MIYITKHNGKLSRQLYSVQILKRADTNYNEDAWMDGRTGWWMDECLDEWMDGRTDGETNGLTDQTDR